MKLSFHGAARTVTGSCHLLEAAGLRILVDCGFFQGREHPAKINAAPFGFDPAQIDYLILTHAHLDHCGRIPLLVKRGFKGEIITTSATRDLAKLIMIDSANIQEEDAERATRRRRRKGRSPVEPVYDVADALRALDFFGRQLRYDEPMALNDDLQVRFISAGHILGSAAVVVEATEGGKTRRIVFSGDLGNRDHRILPDPTPPPEADYVLMESTYGDRLHRSLDASVSELFEAVRTTLDRGGNVIIPTFAMERAQEILFHFRTGIEAGLLPRGLPVYLDSPMAISATEIFRRHADAFREPIRAAIRAHDDPFRLPDLHFVRQVSASMAINAITGGAIIMAGSGMCTGGRVRHHLRHNIWRPECSVVFVGFAAEGTLAREVIDGAKKIHISGEEIEVNAQIWTINGFSAHADQRELLDWHAYTGTPKTTFLVHGDANKGMTVLKQELEKRGVAVRCPTMHETVELE